MLKNLGAIITVTLSTVFTLSSCQRSASQADTQFAMSWGDDNGIGHEAIVYYALEIGRALSTSDAKKQFFMPGAALKPAFTNGGHQINLPMDDFLRGNAATDWPMPPKGNTYVFSDLMSYYNDYYDAHATAERKSKKRPSSSTDWWGEPTLFPLHSLRNQDDAAQRSASNIATSCNLSAQHIYGAAKRALGVFRSNPNLAKNWLGTATHTIQDSYSQDHTLRTGGGYGSGITKVGTDKSSGDTSVKMVTLGNPSTDPRTATPVATKLIALAAGYSNGDYRNIAQMCTYDAKPALPGICEHTTQSQVLGRDGDNIWAGKGTWSFDNLVPTAQAAAYTTYVFLSMMYDQGVQGKTTPSLGKFFSTYFSCATELASADEASDETGGVLANDPSLGVPANNSEDGSDAEVPQTSLQ